LSSATHPFHTRKKEIRTWFKVLNEKEVTQALAEVQKDSTAVYEDLKRDGLKRPFPGGLPGRSR
jgi:hypothetical protein